MKKGFDLWAGTIVTILISVPVISAIIEISHIAALVTYANDHVWIAVIILVGGYVIVIKVFGTIDKVAGQLGGAVSSVTGKAKKGLSDYRQATSKRRREEAIEGKRNIRGAGLATGFLRRAHMADQGGFSPMLRGQRRFRAAEHAMLNKTSDELMKADGGRSGGDDLAMELAQRRGMTAARFEREYAQRLQETGIDAAEATRRARLAAGTVETSFGAKFGSDSLRVAAYKSLLNSKTSYTDPSGENAQGSWERIIGDGTELMADGLMSSTDVVAAVKQRSDRVDRAGVGWGTLQNQVERSFTRYQQGARDGVIADNAETRAAAQTLQAAGLDIHSADNEQAAAARRAAGALARAGQTAIDGGGRATAAQQAAMVIERNSLVGANEAAHMRQEAVFGTAGGQVVSGRHEAVSALSGVMMDNIQDNYANLTRAQAARDSAVNAGAPPADIAAAQQAVNEAQMQFDRELADLASKYDAMAHISPQNAQILAERVMGQTLQGASGFATHPKQITVPDPNAPPQMVQVTVPDPNNPTKTITTSVPNPNAPPKMIQIPNPDPRAGQRLTVQELVEQARGRQGFLEKRREYGSGMAAAAMGGGQQQQQGQQGQAPPPPHSDRRLKRNMHPVGTFKNIQLYRFQYLWSDQVYVGVMAQDLLETHPQAVILGDDGFYRVNYGVLGTKMYTLEEWESRERSTAAVR